jgi:hypothetical protein
MLMLLLLLADALLLASFGTFGGEGPPVERFTASALGKLPAGWKAEQTGEGVGSKWQVTADKTAPGGSGYVLTQLAQGPRPLFNLCVRQEGRYRDLTLSVSFKALRGKIDQGGGLVWRLQDANNYYVARFNPLEDNLRVYHVVKGKRTELHSVDLSLAGARWHTLAITQRGKTIRCSVNGKELINIDDATLADEGLVGLWTKADAETSFDEFRVAALSPAQE